MLTTGLSFSSALCHEILNYSKYLDHNLMPCTGYFSQSIFSAIVADLGNKNYMHLGEMFYAFSVVFVEL